MTNPFGDNFFFLPVFTVQIQTPNQPGPSHAGPKLTKNNLCADMAPGPKKKG